MRIGLFGGTFDPPHRGHLKLAEAARSELNLDKVIFIPAGRSPLKKNAPSMPAAARAKALRDVLEGRPYFSVSAVEIRRRGPSYTVDTLKYFKKRFGGKAVLYFLTGADAAQDLKRWKAWRGLPKLCRFIVMSRPGYRAGNLPDGFWSLPFDAEDVSSTQIRRRKKPSKRS